MAYLNSIGDNAKLLRRTVTGVTYFSGCSRRTEVIYYWIASALVGVLLNFRLVELRGNRTPDLGVRLQRLDRFLAHLLGFSRAESQSPGK